MTLIRRRTALAASGLLVTSATLSGCGLPRLIPRLVGGSDDSEDSEDSGDSRPNDESDDSSGDDGSSDEDPQDGADNAGSDDEPSQDAPLTELPLTAQTLQQRVSALADFAGTSAVGYVEIYQNDVRIIHNGIQYADGTGEPAEAMERELQVNRSMGPVHPAELPYDELISAIGAPPDASPTGTGFAALLSTGTRLVGGSKASFINGREMATTPTFLTKAEIARTWDLACAATNSVLKGFQAWPTFVSIDGGDSGPVFGLTSTVTGYGLLDPGRGEDVGAPKTHQIPAAATGAQVADLLDAQLSRMGWAWSSLGSVRLVNMNWPEQGIVDVPGLQFGGDGLRLSREGENLVAVDPAIEKVKVDAFYG